MVTVVALLLSSNLWATGVACSGTCKEVIEDDLRKPKPSCEHRKSHFKLCFISSVPTSSTYSPIQVY